VQHSTEATPAWRGRQPGADEAAVAAGAVCAASEHAEAVGDEPAALARFGAERGDRHAVQKVPVGSSR